MKKILPILLLLAAFAASAQNYKPVDEGSKVHFVIKNFNIGTGGDLSGLKGNILFNSASLQTSSFNVSVDVNTIDTDNDTRDSHLKSEDYFDAQQFPVINITSTKIDKTNRTSSGWYYFTGTLTMHGVTKAISFPFNVKVANGGLLFTGAFEIDRLDYGVGSKSAVLSKTVKISLSVLTKKI